MRRTVVLVVAFVALVGSFLAFNTNACDQSGPHTQKPVKEAPVKARAITRTQYASGKSVIQQGNKRYSGYRDSQGKTNYRDTTGRVVVSCKVRGNKEVCQ